MPTNQDDKLAETLAAQGIVSRQDVQHCMDEVRHAEQAGQPISLDAVLVRKGLVSRAHADELVAVGGPKRPLGRIGGFQLIEEIGRGGMGTVYKARQISMDRLVALKVLPPNLAKNKAYIDRFFKEARAVARLSHVNIIQGYDVGEASGYYYFAMEYIDGESLAAKLAREATISEIEALNIVEQVARALAHAQSTAGIIHRDIKPDNIMLTKSGMAKLADLGLAKMVGDKTVLTAGTPHYVSPEQGCGSPLVDTRSDIYSLGATLFHMLTGTPPFTGNTPREIIEKHVSQEVQSARDLNPALSTNVCRLISTMMAKKPEERYQTPAELLDDIRLVKQGVPPQKGLKLAGGGAGASRPTRRSSTTWPVAVAVAFMIICGGVAALFLAKANRSTSTADGTGDPGTGGHSGSTQAEQSADALAEAEAFEAQNGWKLSEIIEKYEAVAAQYPQSPAAATASQRAQEVRAKRERNAQSTFNSIKAKADAKAAEEHYSEALDVYNGYPDRLRFGKWNSRIDAEKKKIQAKARDRLAQLQAKARELADKHQYTEAIDALRPGLAFGFSNVTKIVNDTIAEYEKQAADRASERKQQEAAEAREQFAVLLAKVVQLEQEHNYAAALAECDGYINQYPGSVKEARDLRAEVETANQIWTDGLAALHKQINNGVEIRVKGILLKGKLRKVSDRTFTVETTVTMLTKSLDEIDPEYWLMLAGVLGEDKYSVLRQAAFYLATGSADRANRVVADLKDPDVVKEWLEKMRTREKLLLAGRRSAEAVALLARAGEMVQNKQWKELYKQLSALRRDSKAAAAVQNASAEIDSLMDQAARGLAADYSVPAYRQDEFVGLLAACQEIAVWQRENTCAKTVTCPICEGLGTIADARECTRCKGDGTLVCPQCKGRKVETADGLKGATRLCSRCNGKGTIKCTKCNGTGESNERRTCRECYGRKAIPCPACKGTGFKGAMPERLTQALDTLRKDFKVKLDDLAQLVAFEVPKMEEATK